MTSDHTLYTHHCDKEESALGRHLDRILSFATGYSTPDRGLSIQRARKASEKAPQGLAKNDQGEIINRR